MDNLTIWKLLNETIVKLKTLIETNTHAATSKTTPADADEFPGADSADSYKLKKFTWANIKATLGVVDHASLANLAYASSGHTGFASGAITGPAVNILTITNAAASTLAMNITSGKTVTITATDNSSIIFTGACNLTIPTAGSVTAALLGTANVFTATQTIFPATDTISLIVKRQAAASASDILEIQTQAGTIMTRIDKDGMLRVDNNVAGSYYGINVNRSITTPTVGIEGIDVSMTINNAASNAQNATSLVFSTQTNASSAFNFTATFMGIQGYVYHRGSGVLSTGTGIKAGVQVIGSGNITTAYGNVILNNLGATSTGSITNNYLNYLFAPNKTAGASGNFVNSYGLYIEDQIIATTLNYAIYTNGGDIVFNAGGNTLGDFTHKTDDYNSIFSDASNNSIVIMSNAAGKLGFFGAAAVAQSTGWAATNTTPDKSFDADLTTLNEVADVLGSLIEQLKTYGILGA